MMLIHDLYIQFSPPLQGISKIRNISMHSYTPLGPKMCFGAPSKYTHMDRYTDATDTICTFYTCSYHPLYPNSCADLTRIYTIFISGKIWVPSCIESSPTFLHDPHTCSLHVFIWGRTILYTIKF